LRKGDHHRLKSRFAAKIGGSTQTALSGKLLQARITTSIRVCKNEARGVFLFVLFLDFEIGG
jgi:hypothetical protein